MFVGDLKGEVIMYGMYVVGIIVVDGKIKGVVFDVYLFVYCVLGLGGMGIIEDVIVGIECVVEDGVDVMNLLFGDMINNLDLVMSIVLDWVMEEGVVVVMLNGNSGLVNWIVGFLGMFCEVILVGVI